VKPRKPSRRKAKAGPVSLLDIKLPAKRPKSTPEQEAELAELVRDIYQTMAEGAGLAGPRKPKIVRVWSGPDEPAAKPKAGRKRRKAAPKRGRPNGWPFVKEEAIRRLQASDKALLERRKRQVFLEELSKWLSRAHPEARQMAPKTIGDHLREDADTRVLLPKAWKRRS
jgi:hypothetical protein